MLVYLILFIIGEIFIFRNFTSVGTASKTSEIAKALATFSRPQKLTEEEVSVSKEKKTCLVCKSKISGMTFVCRDCGTFYCEKCFTALSGLENACWACYNALDHTRPVKLEKKEEKELEIETEPHKDMKGK